MLNWRSLLVFFPLAFLLSWYPYILGKTHLVRTSGGMNPLGVMVAAIVAAAICYRGAGVKELLGRYLRWRIGWSNYIFALLLPVGIVALGAVLNVLLGARLARIRVAELQKRFSPLATSLILGVIWAAWHIPLLGVEFRGQIIPAFLLGVMSASVLTTWLFNHSKESLLPQPLFHATVNTTGAGYVFQMFRGAELARLWWIYTVLWVIAAVLSVLLSPRMVATPASAASPSGLEKSLPRAAL